MSWASWWLLWSCHGHVAFTAGLSAHKCQAFGKAGGAHRHRIDHRGVSWSSIAVHPTGKFEAFGGQVRTGRDHPKSGPKRGRSIQQGPTKTFYSEVVGIGSNAPPRPATISSPTWT